MRSDLAGWAQYGYCASHSRYFWGLRLHLGQTLIGDKNYFGADFQTQLAQTRAVLLRPGRKGEPDPAAPPLFKPLRQTIESINQTLKGQLDLERHGRHTCNGVAIRVLQRILALTAVIWHNDKIGAPIKRSLIAYDH
jgi:hypothetical protein